jgi:hypothetical protein
MIMMMIFRCVVLPGTVMKKLSVLGSGSISNENFTAPIGSVWVGSRNGQPVCFAPMDISCAGRDTLTPFGKAFYHNTESLKSANSHNPKISNIPLHGYPIPYSVLSLPTIAAYNMCWKALCAVYRSSPVVISLYLVVHYHDFPEEVFLLSVYLYGTLAMTLIWALAAICAIAFAVAAKYLCMGMRKAGEYAWDTSDYCQRWQIYLTLLVGIPSLYRPLPINTVSHTLSYIYIYIYLFGSV